MENNEYISQLLESKKESLNAKEFKVPDAYFDQVKMEINLKKRVGDGMDFIVPTNYFEKIEKPKHSKIFSKALYFISSSAAILLIGSLVFTSIESDCQSFDCLLEQTEISAEDLDYLEENEISLFSYEEE